MQEWFGARYEEIEEHRSIKEGENVCGLQQQPALHSSLSVTSRNIQLEHDVLLPPTYHFCLCLNRFTELLCSRCVVLIFSVVGTYTDPIFDPVVSASGFTYDRIDKNNVVLLVVDHQEGLYQLSRDMNALAFKTNVFAHAALAKVFNLPTILTTSAETGMSSALY